MKKLAWLNLIVPKLIIIEKRKKNQKKHLRITVVHLQYIIFPQLVFIHIFKKKQTSLHKIDIIILIPLRKNI